LWFGKTSDFELEHGRAADVCVGNHVLGRNAWLLWLPLQVGDGALDSELGTAGNFARGGGRYASIQTSVLGRDVLEDECQRILVILF
jgi:hypothetical protein